jgi:enediyne biosynthesis protein E4
VRWFAVILLLVCGCLAGCGGRGGPSVISEPESAPPDPFQDVTQRSGIDFRLQPAKRPMRILESVGSGCGMLDYDGDGDLDLLLVGSPRCALYRNTGDRRFEDVTQQAGLARSGTWITCAVADYDRDGDADLALAGYRSAALFRNSGNGTFREVAGPAGIGMKGWCNTAAFADFDRDGYPDLYLGAYVQFGPASRQYCLLHANQVRTSCRPLDYDPEKGHCFRNRGDGTFEDVTRRWGLDAAHGKNLGVAVADYDDDGWPDLYLANDEVPQDLFRNLQGRGFRNVAVETGTAFTGDGGLMGGMGVDWGDYDNDGWMDLVVGTFEDEPKALFRSRKGRSFEWDPGRARILGPSHPSVVFGSLLFDYDNDGHLDLIFASGHVFDNVTAIKPTSAYRQPVQLFRNRGGGVFAVVSSPTLAVPIVGRGLACGDYDQDGDLDLLVADSDGAARLLENVAARDRHWLLVQAVGSKSNRDALGARVTLRVGGTVRVDEVRSTRSYASACDPRVHFGLGKESRVDEVEVRWPSGAVTRLNDVPADRVLVVREGG